jgi:hypothetical protein
MYLDILEDWGWENGVAGFGDIGGSFMYESYGIYM